MWRRGATALEMALVLPVALALILGMMEWSWLLFQWHTVESSALRGVRLLSAVPDAAARDAIATEQVRDHLRVFGVDADRATVTTAVEDRLYGRVVTVEVHVHTDPLIGFVLAPTDLGARATAPWFGDMYATPEQP
jgi:Flp pilus assembly protein TadG